MDSQGKREIQDFLDEMVFLDNEETMVFQESKERQEED